MLAAAPMIGIIASTRNEGHGRRSFIVGEKYLQAIITFGGTPVIIPPLSSAAIMLEHLDGILLTGSASNVDPRYYGGASDHLSLRDPDRDDFVMPLIMSAITAAIPILGICRGLQEINVALGGSLYPAVHALPNRIDHRAPATLNGDDRYGIAHPITLVAGGLLAQLAQTDLAEVNSLHGEAIDRLAPDLIIEATASDGTIEAVRHGTALSLVLGVQWHPEHPVARAWPLSRAIFAHFIAAARRHAARQDAPHI